MNLVLTFPCTTRSREPPRRPLRPPPRPPPPRVMQNTRPVNLTVPILRHTYLPPDRLGPVGCPATIVNNEGMMFRMWILVNNNVLIAN